MRSRDYRVATGLSVEDFRVFTGPYSTRKPYNPIRVGTKVRCYLYPDSKVWICKGYRISIYKSAQRKLRQF
jgi:hypothetical protein